MLLFTVAATGCVSNMITPPLPVSSGFEHRKPEEFQERRTAEEAERHAMEKRAEAARKRKAERIAHAEEMAREERELALRDEQDRQRRITEAQQRELERQEQYRQAIAAANGEPSSMPIVTTRYDLAAKNGTLPDEIKKIREDAAGHDGIVIGGFRLGMDIQDAYLLARALFKNSDLRTDSYRGSLRIRLGTAEKVDMSGNLEGAFVAGLFGDDASFVFAEADSGTRQVNSFRFTAEMVKNLLKLKGPISNDQLARTVFRKLGLDWEYNFEYDVYSFVSSKEAFHGFSKATKLSNSLTVVNPGDFTLKW